MLTVASVPLNAKARHMQGRCEGPSLSLERESGGGISLSRQEEGQDEGVKCLQ